MHPALVTVLEDRLLLANGISVVEPESVIDLFLAGLSPECIQVTEINEDIGQFNLRSDVELKVFSESDSIDLDYTWLIPEEYQQLNVIEYFAQLLYKKNATSAAYERVGIELEQVIKFKFEMGLRTIIFVVDTFKKNNIVWGVGRGSSCASYLLFLLGLHCVDPLKYNIHYSEFFHE
jgi:DNA polymerase III alpha subunit